MDIRSTYRFLAHLFIIAIAVENASSRMQKMRFM